MKNAPKTSLNPKKPQNQVKVHVVPGYSLERVGEEVGWQSTEPIVLEGQVDEAELTSGRRQRLEHVVGQVQYLEPRRLGQQTLGKGGQTIVRGEERAEHRNLGRPLGQTVQFVAEKISRYSLLHFFIIIINETKRSLVLLLFFNTYAAPYLQSINFF